MRPEPKFFLQSNLDHLSRDDYLNSYFSEETPVRGEKSTSYIESEYAAKSINQWFPEAKIIFLLRNPIDRAISNYRFSRQHGVETLSLKDAFIQEENRRDKFDHSKFSTSPYAYLKRGIYIDYLKVYERYFARDHMLIYLFEELVGSVTSVQSLYESLGVDNTLVPEGLKTIVNASEEQVEHDVPDNLVNYLVDYFSDANRELAHFLGHDLSVWGQGAQSSSGQQGKNE